MSIDRRRLANVKWLALEWAKQFRQFTTESFGFTREEIAGIMDEVYARGDRLIAFVLLGSWLLLFAQAFFYRTWLAAALGGGAAVAAFLRAEAGARCAAIEAIPRHVSKPMIAWAMKTARWLGPKKA